MPNIRIYTTPICPYCARAKALLTEKGAAFEEVDVYMDAAARKEMMQRSSRRTVPQIFIGERHIGGCDDLVALDEAGELAPLLAAE
jgi:glutaredoxin 3